MSILKGKRVTTPGGPGTVAYMRMAPPDFRTPAAISVVLDNQRERIDYAGTIYGAADVRPEQLDVDAPPVPAGKWPRVGVEYGCGQTDCGSCYEDL